MPRRTNAPLSRADALALASAAYAEIAPLPLVHLRAGIDTTHTAWARQHDLEIHKAETALKVAHKKGKLKRAKCRVSDERQAQWVYWPATVEPPAGVVAE